jgi:Nickel responsive protein SCO4226-like
MKRYLIERDLPGVGNLEAHDLKEAAQKSNEALAALKGRVQWVESFVADDKTYCVYLAEDEAAVNEHARISGFPASRITEVRSVIDPMTGSL